MSYQSPDPCTDDPNKPSNNIQSIYNATYIPSSALSTAPSTVLSTASSTATPPISLPLQQRYNHIIASVPSAFSGQGMQPPAFPISLHADNREMQFKEFCRKYEISPTFQEDIDAIRKYDIVVIADDSGSMAEPSEYLSYRTNKFVKKTRWDELCETIEVITELAILLDDDGIDLWFLNVAEPVRNITSKQTIMENFDRRPQGRTPLTRVLSRVMQEQSASGKPKLILIATDGEPNTDDGYDDCKNFLNLLKTRDVNMNRVGILACTTSDKQMKWLARVDIEAKHVDVIDDFLSEREQIIKVQGKGFTYSHGDHILKMLLGPILQKYDDLDEKPLRKQHCNCTIS
jgi:hypothetical protein